MERSADEGDGPAYMPVEFVRVPAGREHELVHVPSRRLTLTLTTQASLALQACRGMAPLRAHARQAARVFGLHPSRAALLERQLHALVASGLLVSSDEALARARAAGGQVASAKVTCLALPTRDRPELLARGLPGFIENALDFGHRLRALVIDDSREACSRAANRELATSLSARYGTDVRCVDLEARARFASALAARAGAPPAVAEFGLLNPESLPLAFGAARNALLLDTLGELVVQTDDDTLCHIGPSPDARPGLSFSSRNDPTEFHFFAHAKGPREAVTLEPQDFVGLHEELLGRGLGVCADGSLGPHATPAWDEPAPGFLSKLGAGARVGVTALGIAGDCGMDSPLHYLFVGEASRQRLWGQGESHAAQAFLSRQVVRATARRTVCDGAHCASTNLGLDNRLELPPFFPVQRNEDGCFGMVLRACSRTAYFGFLPYVLFHEPVPERRFDARAAWARPAALGTGDLVRLLILSFQGWPRADDDARNLRALGGYLADCAGGSDFTEFIRAQYVRWVAVRLADIERRLRETSDSPPAWRRDVERYRGALLAELGRDDATLPADLVADRGREGALALLRTLVGRYALLLQEWPALRAAAAELKRRGEGLTAPA